MSSFLASWFGAEEAVTKKDTGTSVEEGGSASITSPSTGASYAETQDEDSYHKGRASSGVDKEDESGIVNVGTETENDMQPEYQETQTEEDAQEVTAEELEMQEVDNFGDTYQGEQDANRASEVMEPAFPPQIDNDAELTEQQRGQEVQEVGENTETQMSDSDTPDYAELWGIGAITCCCVPTRVSGMKDFGTRTVAWTLLNKDQIFSGVTVAIAQVPEVISYAVIAGVDPLLALHGTWIMSIITGLFGGRPGMISGATASVAVALINLVQESGTEYMIYAVMLAGILQVTFGLFKLGALLRFVPFPAMIGFVNVMALIITFGQLKFLKEPGAGANKDPGMGRVNEAGFHTNYYQLFLGETPWVDLRVLSPMLIEIGIAFVVCLIVPMIPKVGKLIPSTFLAIFLVSILEWAIARQVGFPTTLVKDYGEVKAALPTSPLVPYSIPPLNFDTFQKVWPTGLTIFAVSTVESLMTYTVIGGYTGTRGSANRMAVGQGIANFFSSLLVGGMGGGAMVSQSIVNNKSGGVSGLSSVVAGLVLFVFLAGAYPAVGIVPLAAIVGVMLYAAFNLLQWHSFVTILAVFFPQKLRDLLFLDCKVNRWDTVIMLAVMGFTFFFDLAIGVLVACAVGALAYAWDSSNTLTVDRVLAEGEETVTYRIKGPLCFATADVLEDIFTDDVLQDDPDDVILLLEDAEIFDWSGMVALKKLYTRFESSDRTVALSSLTPSSKKIMEKNSSMWYGVVFLEMQEVDDEDMSAKDKVANVNGIEEEQNGAGREAELEMV